MQKELDVHIDCGIVYLISPETVATNWLENDEVQVPQNLIENKEFQES